MYEIGELIFYGDAGVCRVTDIAAQELPGTEVNQLCYVLKPLYHDYIISIPVNSTKVFMRPIISKQMAEQLIDMIPSIQGQACHGRAFELAGRYEASIKSYDCAELIELTMSLYAKKQDLEQQKRKFRAVDERFMKRAEELLFGELAAALGIPKSEVPKYIASRVEKPAVDTSQE